jgi:protein-disulfide isomerase
MSSRAEAKAEARQARMAAEAEAEAHAARRRRLIIFGGILAVAAAILLVVVLVSSGGDDDGGATDRVAIFDGIPQQGPWLGRANAPVVVEEYADLQCPFCAAFAKEQLPGFVEDNVRTGKVRMRLRLLTFIGPESVKAAQVAHGAQQQDKGWNFAEAFYADQGPENSGYVSDAFLRDVSKNAGVDADKALAAQSDPTVDKLIAADKAAATKLRIQSTPSFAVGPRGGPLKLVPGDQLQAAVDAAAQE